MAELFDHPHTVIGPQFTRATVNVNTPEELLAAEALVKISPEHPG
jgi:GTP:adenosylcobinamide-phosphate guanylyltransferase